MQSEVSQNFFDVFFKFVAKHRCLKENGCVVLPFHPRVIAGLFRVNNKPPVNVVKDWKFFDEIMEQWQDQISKRDCDIGNGFNHKLGLHEFNAELRRQVKDLEVESCNVKALLESK